MLEPSPIHNTELDHHLKQGVAWLSRAQDGASTAVLSYAALELRFCVERIAAHYWITLLDRPPEEQEWRTLEAFNRVQHSIYKLGGHQQEIDLHFGFIRVALRMMKVDADFRTPSIGALARYWHTCSERCHITWPLSSGNADEQRLTVSALTTVAEGLAQHVQSLGWPLLRDASFTELRNRFVAGNATELDVENYIRERGLWARIEFGDGRPSLFAGEAVPPESNLTRP